MNGINRLDAKPINLGRDEAQKMCFSKKGYHTAAFAGRVAATIRKHSARDVPPLRIYECPVCGMWHLTSKDAK